MVITMNDVKYTGKERRNILRRAYLESMLADIKDDTRKTNDQIRGIDVKLDRLIGKRVHTRFIAIVLGSGIITGALVEVIYHLF